MMKFRVIILSTVLAFSLNAQSYAAGSTQASKPLVLQNVMKVLGENMQTIAGAISQEDWALVEQEAMKVADHPKPPMAERMKIMGFMGKKMSVFKNNDGKTHDAATKLSLVAAEQDGFQVIQVFAELQQTCLTCHQSFRQSFKDHFYGTGQ